MIREPGGGALWRPLGGEVGAGLSAGDSPDLPLPVQGAQNWRPLVYAVSPVVTKMTLITERTAT